MTTPTDGAFFGQDVGVAQRALRGLLDSVLTAAGTDFPTWLALRTLDQVGAIDPTALRDELAARLTTDPATAGAVLDRIADHGWTDPGGTRLSPAGAAFYRDLVERVTRATADLYAAVDPADLATARRVLAGVTERATAQLGAG